MKNDETTNFFINTSVSDLSHIKAIEKYKQNIMSNSSIYTPLHMEMYVVAIVQLLPIIILGKHIVVINMFSNSNDIIGKCIKVYKVSRLQIKPRISINNKTETNPRLKLF